MIKDKYELMTDFYQFSMANGFVDNGINTTEVWFDMFFRRRDLRNCANILKISNSTRTI